MLKYIQISVSKKFLIGLFTLFLSIIINAQEETVIDNKGTLIVVRNTVVTTAATAPMAPLENDVWFDTTNNLTKIYDGTAWIATYNFYTVDSSLTNDRIVDADGNSLSITNLDGGYNIIGQTTGVGETAANTSDGALLHISQESAWSPAGPWALYVEGYSFLNGFRINGEDDIRSLYTRNSHLGFAAQGNIPITFTQNDSEVRLSIIPDGELQFHEYGDGNITGTATQFLGVEDDGRVVEINLASLTVSADDDNSLSTGSDSGVFYESPIKAFGKIASDGSIIKATPGVFVEKLTGNGYYRINLPATAVTDNNYIIQLSQPGRNGAGNDDPGISYFNQNTTSFEVIIGDNDNGGTDRARFNSEFMFTILDL